MKDTNAAFGSWLREARRETGLSQKQLCDALAPEGLHFHQSQLAKIERGERPVRLSEAAVIVKLFGTTLDVALGLQPGARGVAVEQADRLTQAARRTALLTRLRDQIDAELGGETS